MAIQGTIFPNSCRETESTIFSYTPDRALVNLSSVNVQASRVFCNDFFKNRFYQRFPHLAEYKNILRILREYHSGNCWKVACSYIGSDLPMLPCVFQQAWPLIEAKQKQKIEQICGSYCEDPKSPIDKAWKAFAACGDMKLVTSKTVELCQTLNLFQFEHQLPTFVVVSRLIINNFNKEAEDRMDNALVPASHDKNVLISAFKHLQKYVLMQTLLEDYQKLEDKRLKCINTLQNPDKKHSHKLSKEFMSVRVAAFAPKKIQALKECLSLVQELIARKEEPSLNEREEMTKLLLCCFGTQDVKSVTLCLANLPGIENSVKRELDNAEHNYQEALVGCGKET